MYEDFDYYKAKEFLKRTNQCKYIVKAVDGLLPYYETDILDMIEHLQYCNYYMIEKLYCLIMQDMDYDVPFTLDELFKCIANYPKKKYKEYNPHAYEYVSKLYKRLLELYPF